MSFLDPAKNFAIVDVSTGYTSTDTSITLATGEGAKLPDPATEGEYNLVWWDNTNYRNPSDDPNKEIVRVTAKSTDTLTVVRAQEGTVASNKNTAGSNYKMALGFTQKMRDDLESFLQGQTAASIASAATVDLGAVKGQNVHITGNATISSFGTAPAGTFRRVEFDGNATLQYNATSMKLPGNANITTEPGDVAYCVSLGSGNWKVEAYIPARGVPVVQDGTGKVGIGTTAPQAKLHVEGTSFADSALRFNNTANSGSSTYWEIGERSYSATDSRLEINKDGTAQATFTSTGLGIGITYPNAKLDINGDVLFRKRVLAKTANYAILAGDSNTFFTNEGATAAITLTLPAAQAGLTYTFYVQTAQQLTIQLATGNTLRTGNGVTTAGGTAYTSQVGNLIKVVAINGTEWVAETIIGTWTLT